MIIDNPKTSLISYLKTHEYVFLITFTILTLILHPFLIDAVNGQLVLHILISCVLLSGMRSVGGNKDLVTLTVFFGTTALLLTWADYRIGQSEFTLLYSVAAFVFFVFVTAKVLLGIFSHPKVNSHTIFGAIAGYMMIGMSGAFLFNIIEVLQPGSFSAGIETLGAGPSYLYYSFVTMLTIGFGDIIPLGAHAQTRSVIMAITGQLYLTIIIGLLIGKYVRDK